MIYRFSIAALIVWTSLIVRAQDSSRPYKPFRYDEDWSFLANSANRDGWLDQFKYIRLGSYDYYLTLGGEIREKFELVDKPGFGTGSYDPYGYLLQRYLLLADFHLGHRFRIFTELQSGLEEGRVGGPRSTDVDVLDGHQGFLDWRVTTGKFVRTTIRVGRQEVGFGSGRLIAPAEGLNLRRSMDGARIMADFGKLKWSASALRLVQANPGIFDNVPDHTQTLAGSGIETPWIGGETSRFAVYYMWFDKKSSTFSKGSGREIRDTAGLHVWKSPGTALDYDDEALFQWGSFRGSPIRAWALSESTGYTFERLPLHPRIGVRADLASGDRGITTRTLGTFDPQFPNVSVYSGPSALLGASNLINVTASFKLQLKTHASLVVESSSFWRQSLRDSVYTPFNTPLRAAIPGGGRYVATAPAATFSWQATRHVSYTVIYTHWFTGDCFRLAPPDHGMNYVGTWTAYRF
jgi:hypothetical protein